MRIPPMIRLSSISSTRVVFAEITLARLPVVVTLGLEPDSSTIRISMPSTSEAYPKIIADLIMADAVSFAITRCGTIDSTQNSLDPR